MFGNSFLLHRSLRPVNFGVALSGHEKLLFEEPRVFCLHLTSACHFLFAVPSFVFGQFATQPLKFCQVLSSTNFRRSSRLPEHLRRMFPPAFLPDLCPMIVNGRSH
jgi:hypothetical protein